MKRFGYYPLISRWSILTPNGITTCTKAFRSITKANNVLVLCYNWNMMIAYKSIWKGINFMSDNYVGNFIGKRQWVRIFLCCHVKFLEIHTNSQLPIFLGTTTIGDSQVTSSIDLIKLVINNLSMSCLIIATCLGFNHILLDEQVVLWYLIQSYVEQSLVECQVQVFDK